MPKLKKKENPIIHIHILSLLKEVNSYIFANPLFSLCIFVVNMLYMLIYKSIENGISNPLSIIWIVSYYIFWCAFYRYYYHQKPYIFSKNIFGSLAPSTKALVFMFLITAIIIILPMIPLFLGFDEIYLDYYESYIRAIENLSTNDGKVASLVDILVVYGILSLLAPILICKPYMAWISSLRGYNSSFKKAAEKLNGNYLNFVIISLLLFIPEAIFREIDRMLNLQNWLSYFVSTIIFVYTNVIFAKIYDLFYIKN